MADPKSGTLTLTITHPFLHDFESSNDSIKITPVAGSEENPPYLDLSFKVKAGSTTDAIFEFKSDENVGLHKMKTVDGPSGLIWIEWIEESPMRRVGTPQGKPALFFCSDGEPDWIPAAEDNMLFNKDHFEPIVACEDACQ